MPELPEVETVRRGLAPHLVGRRLLGARVREGRLRWPVPDDLDDRVAGRRVDQLERRGKYLIVTLDRGYLILHLGMSGSLRLVTADSPVGKHDHLDFLIEGGDLLRYRDPRRFGAILWCDAPERHPLIASLGIEPLEAGFDGDWLYQASRAIRAPVKSWLMDAHVVVGIGNIYANESLFHAGIHPLLPADRLTRPRCRRLAEAIRTTLERAIAAGGSTLRDFVDGHGEPGYFQQTYYVYGRAGEPCRVCGETVRSTRLGNRTTCFCPKCQKK
ncbi:MAG: bifunctional DNA-formamidopyrimidine glycosylase/DNA-(apurinic or apyrimidinic site) lyase [Thiobacillus sp.]|nr:bifunctional DNA-formamidopyrimidine glycosylase/DNA-(apurinic or apyrimidinic site) lyase [Thiobacillus sp.]